jgi:hypothetical protein
MTAIVRCPAYHTTASLLQPAGTGSAGARRSGNMPFDSTACSVAEPATSFVVHFFPRRNQCQAG